MIGLLQRVTRASVVVSEETVGCIDKGLLVLLGVEKKDGEAQARRLLERLLNYRVFPDENGKMNQSLRDMQGGLLLVPQFTLPADTRKGNRPSFTPAADPETGKCLFEYVLQEAKKQHSTVASGVFGADMQVHLVNDGPVTFWLQV
ncbi:D-aminoacyl-tRNA deacylase [Candidatus Venteria ishoeyi]|uniref:D-aminoacyl-tRNA deacylase n=1 Tax=Candidatus Venteria ishoeyi TaxID=1899563 RepID=UPI0025A54EBB|nr:D-aminoacyl-tRNA deacylase [Candidatus Venteria ishoeyi]MDM8546134.1 D-aminoacyl-tRNA deacylase [Candidatus Venteria ishoeyi]